ncbi:MAG: hypothetical protein UT24_C0033G0014 [Candidatus Woesebacteria bacterium GW2011_GWB1_39_12]|uniref:Uncharacterized protein n=1 Tax=Candidatus Woesebacteria bacterium GW2011_GWB1_39_12 TaxID=1618574 RepID=A0A0G0PL54_9BACT|nr:MAG: hypothetical protein UT24_C0033G0014 [Candidatus Woesebacteria bacterium GW2011_GWB1_39_12]
MTTDETSQLSSFVARLNDFNQYFRYVFREEEITILQSPALFDRIPCHWRSISFVITSGRIKMKGWTYLPHLNNFKNTESDVLIIGKDFQPIVFCPSELLKFFWKLVEIEGRLNEIYPRERSIVCLGLQTQFTNMLCKDPWHFLDTFRPNHGLR